MDPARSASADITRVPAERLTTFTRAVLGKVGLSDDDADLFTTMLVWRDMREAHPVGLAALPGTANALSSGASNATARPSIAKQTGAVAMVDGAGGLGQIAMAFAMRHAVATARTSGIGLSLVRNSGTAGTMGYYPTLAIAEGMVGFVITNSPPMQPPWGGTTKVLGNQAFALGAPAGRHHPLLFDGAATSTSNATINSLARRGLRLPEGVALDASGQPTTDPAAALAGMLLPSGGHKGYALSVFWEVLSNALGDVIAPTSNDDREGAHFVLAIDPRASVGSARFAESVDALIDRIHESPPAEGVDRVYAPGERGYLTAIERRTTGIPLRASRIAELTALGKKMDIAF